MLPDEACVPMEKKQRIPLLEKVIYSNIGMYILHTVL